MTKDLPEVRLALPVDEAELMAMCRRLWKENGLFSFSETKVSECLRRYYRADNTIVAVIGAPGKIEASMCLMVSEFYYTTDWHLAELWNFVDEEYRRSRNAEALIEFGKDCSDKMQIPFFTGIITNRQMAGKVRLYRRMLGHPAGAFFVHNSNWETEPISDHSILRGRLREFANRCTENKIANTEARKQIAPLLREAADALGAEDNIWSSQKAKNGSAHSEWPS
jgi:hypothetical protein